MFDTNYWPFPDQAPDPFKAQVDQLSSTENVYIFLTTLFGILQLVYVIFKLLCTMFPALHFSPIWRGLENFWLFLSLTSLAIAYWWLPSMTFTGYWALTVIATILVLVMLVMMFVKFINFVKLFYRTGSFAIAIRGPIVLVALDVTIKLHCTPFAILVKEVGSIFYLSEYCNKPLNAAQIAALKICVNGQWFAYTRSSTTSAAKVAAANSTAKYHLYILQGVADYTQLSSVKFE